MHEAIYNQKLDDDIASRLSSVSSTYPRINIRTYSSILSTNICSAVPSVPSVPLTTDQSNTQGLDKPIFSIITQNLVSRAISEIKYDVVICATGYQRSSWIKLLKESDIGKTFGLHSGSHSVQLIPVSSRHSRQIDDAKLSGPSDFNILPSRRENHSTTPLYISRHYQLLPSKYDRADRDVSSFEPRIYLQGVEEATHGMSDTLLSVIGIRAGEVVEDICRGRIEKTWLAESKL